MVANVELRRLDPKASLPKVVAALNTLIDRDLGNDGGQIKHYGYDGTRQQTVSSDGVSAGAVTSSANYTHDVHSAHASGLLAAFRLPATTKAAAPTVSNCAALVQAVGVLVGAGKALRVYAAGGVNYAELTSDAAGNLGIGGTTGALTLNGNVRWKSGTAFVMELDHAATADRVITVPDRTDTLALLGATQTLSAKTVSLVDGAAATPSLRFDNDTDTGLYRVTSTTGRLGVTCDGTQVLEVVNNGSTFGLGIGAAPSTALTVTRNVADYLGTFTNANSRGLGLTVATGGTNAADRLLGLFSNTSTERFSVFADGVVSLASGQLKFPASQNASSDANTLDDYEEGTWTPSIGGTATYTTQTGTYIKIGRVVVCWCQLQINVRGTGSQSTISGLPFSADNNASGVVDTWGTLAVNPTEINVVTSGSTAIIVGATAAAAASGTLNALQDGALVRFQVTYRTAS